MAKQIAKLLRADISESSNLMEIARMLEKKGRGNDTILAHITKKEAQMLKDAGGSGTVNPETGLLEFFDGDYQIPETYSYGADYGAMQAQTAPYEFPSANQRPLTGDRFSAASEYNSPIQSEPVPTQMSMADIPTIGLPRYEVTPQLGRQEFTSVPGGVTPVQPSVAAAEMAGDRSNVIKDMWNKLSDDQKIRLGLSGGLGLFGAYQGRRAAKQAEARAGEMQALGRPYQQQGAELQRAAMAGEMTPQSAQAYQALQARLAQGVEQRGGVGAAQAAAQAEAFRQQLLANQYNLGLQVSNIGDNIAIGAIRTGMQADQQLNQINSAFATQLGAIAAGLPMRTTPNA